MSEKRLRDALTSVLAHRPGTQRDVMMMLDTLLSEHRAEMDAARDAALEEAAQLFYGEFAERIRALRSQRRSEERRSEEWRQGVAALADTVGANVDHLLGVPLDTEPERGSKCQSTLKDCNGVSTRACGRCDSCCGHARGICATDPESER